MTAATVLEHVSGVRSTGRHHWRADCPNPVHEHVRGSLAITEADNGVVLLHCFACGDTAAILHALGLTAACLFPGHLRDLTPGQLRETRAAFRRNAWAAALAALRLEISVVLVAANQVGDGVTLSNDDLHRVRLAALRIFEASEVLHD